MCSILFNKLNKPLYVLFYRISKAWIACKLLKLQNLFHILLIKFVFFTCITDYMYNIALIACKFMFLTSVISGNYVHRLHKIFLSLWLIKQNLLAASQATTDRLSVSLIVHNRLISCRGCILKNGFIFKYKNSVNCRCKMLQTKIFDVILK